MVKINYSYEKKFYVNLGIEPVTHGLTHGIIHGIEIKDRDWTDAHAEGTAEGRLDEFPSSQSSRFFLADRKNLHYRWRGRFLHLVLQAFGEWKPEENFIQLSYLPDR